jgi:hypothetical protein
LRGRSPERMAPFATNPEQSVRDFAPELIIDEDCMRLYFHRHLGIVHHEIRKELNSEVFRRVLLRGVALLEETHSAKWLSDVAATRG